MQTVSAYANFQGRAVLPGGAPRQKPKGSMLEIKNRLLIWALFETNSLTRETYQIRIQES